MDTRLPVELIIARADWERMLAALLSQRGTWGLAHLRRNQHSSRIELIARQIEVLSQAPSGPQFLPLTDWAVIVAPDDDWQISLSGLIDSLKPLPGQTLALLAVGLGSQRRGWDGCVVHSQRTVALDGFRVNGRGMLHVRRGDIDESDLERELDDRWSRTRRAVGPAAWRRLTAANVALFGASRTGSLMAWQLTALGVRKLVLIDPDRVALHNLNATVAFEESDVGKPKVASLARHLSRLHRGLAVCGLPWSAADPRVTDRIRDADLLVTCVDNDAPRLLAARLAAQWLRPHLDVGTGVVGEGDDQRTIAGDVRLLLPREGCVACVGGLSGMQQAHDQLLRGPGTLPRNPPPAWHEQRAGSLITINAMAVGIGVQLLLDLLGGHLRHSHWSRLLWRPGQGIAVDQADVTGAADCGTCGRRSEPRQGLLDRHNAAVRVAAADDCLCSWEVGEPLKFDHTVRG